MCLLNSSKIVMYQLDFLLFLSASICSCQKQQRNAASLSLSLSISLSLSLSASSLHTAATTPRVKAKLQK